MPRISGECARAGRTLLIGVGNVLLSDEGVGVHVARALDRMQRGGRIPAAVAVRDGGTIGLALLGELADCEALIVIDAMELGASPGMVRAFCGADVDAQLRGKQRTAHELGVADLIGAAALTGCAPARRALVGIQPGSTAWGLTPSEPVLAAVPRACGTVLSLLEEWQHAARA